ncbi:VCAM1 protein, partial [Pluvianellus socialis]|nr:VCAM1 protein [Pluvianellus socialis]
MDPCRSWGAMALLCLLVPGGHPDLCRVSISPEEPAVEFGTSLLFNCTSSCRNYTRLSWEVSVTKIEERGPGWVSLSIPNVTDWRLELHCFGVFGEQRDIATTTLHAYRKDRGSGAARGGVPAPSPPHPTLSFPAGFSPPRIYQEGDTVAGRETRVTCNASAQASPPGPPNLRLTLWGEGLPPSTRQGPSVTLAFTAQPEQHGQEVTCEAVLRLGRRRTVNASATATLWVRAAPYDVRVWAPRTVFTAGDNLTVTCRAEGNPRPCFRWELPTNASWELRDGSATVIVLAAHRVHAGTYRCLAENSYGTGAASVDVLFQGSSRSPLIPVAVTLAVVTVLAILALSWWFYRARGWKPMSD